MLHMPLALHLAGAPPPACRPRARGAPLAPHPRRRAPPARRGAPAPAPAASSSPPPAAAAAAPSYADAPAAPVAGGAFPQTSGVYAVLDAGGALQYVGMSRRVAVSVATHAEALPELAAAVKVWELPGASKEELTAAWRAWVEQVVAATGAVPPGNAPGEKAWQQRRPAAPKPELRLTPGKGADDLAVPLSVLIEGVVKSHAVVAFVKGTRAAPQCGFSHKVLGLLADAAGGDFEVVNVLDEVHNPGLREEIKAYSQWPTIPQVYVGGEFLGGADIVEEMHGAGELRAAVAAARRAAAA